MTFPAIPRNAIAELFVGGTWVNVTADVRSAEGIIITRGRPNESGQSQPASCALTLDDRSGDYSPRNPMGVHYGSIGRNTPIRVGIEMIEDPFTRTTVNGWGSPDTGSAYTLVFNGGVFLNSDFQVAGGVGTMSLPVTNGYRFVYLPESYRDVDVAVTVSLPFTNVTGGEIHPANILLRGRNTDNYYIVRVAITTAETVTISLMYRSLSGSFTTLASAVTVPGLTHTSAQSLRVRAQAEAQTLRAKVWNADGDEPYGWHVEAHAEQLNDAGWIGIRSGVPTGNTNTLPIVFTYDNLVVTRPRFFGEIAELSSSWDTTGIDITAAVVAAGITRRLGQGTAAQQSTLHRGIIGLPIPAVAYWAAEDGTDSVVVGSAIGGPPMLVSGDTNFAAYSDIASSAPIPTLTATSSWSGAIPPYTDTNEVQLRFIANCPTSLTHNETIACVWTAGAMEWQIRYQTGGGLNIELWKENVNVFFSGSIAFNIDDLDMMFSLELKQNGTSIDWTMKVLEIGKNIGTFFSTSTASQTLGSAVRVQVAPHLGMNGLSIGHINVRKEITSLFDLDTELDGYRGETTINRIDRLCVQNGISLAYINDPAILSARVGPQRTATLLELLAEAAEADRGTLYDSRGALSVVYRERSSLYNQDPLFNLDYSAGQVAEPFALVDDDQQTRNDITVTRSRGTFAQAELVTGRMSVLEPSEGGVGRYDVAFTLNVYQDAQLDNIAGFELRKGTVDDTRYPTVTIDLHNPHITADPDLSRRILDFDVDDKFTISNPPVGQITDDITQIGRGYTERIGNFTHSIAINAAPAEPYEVLQFNGGAGRPAKFDTGGSVLASGVTSTATSFSVTITGTALWTTDAGQMPISVRLGGEVVSVTAISGASSPQAFTVVRSMNGIVKAHAAGTALSLTHRPVFAL